MSNIAGYPRWIAGWGCLLLSLSSMTLWAQAPTADNLNETGYLTYDAPQTQTWRVGLTLDSGRSNYANVMATFPIFTEWPEQSVRLVDQQVSPLVQQWAPRELLGTARQVKLFARQVPAGSNFELILTFEVERSRIVGPTEQQTAGLRIPTRIDRKLRPAMGSSPYIDTGDARIKAAAREIGELNAENDWQRVEQIYDWVREHVEYSEGKIKSAAEALRDGKGDCEELTSLFIALCRIHRIPARVVWIPGHCYPEFYLEDAEGNGTWFPCQAAGTRQFGRMDEYRPVIHKGDRFKVPEQTAPQRYVSEFFTCNKLPGAIDPDPVFVREIVN